MFWLGSGNRERFLEQHGRKVASLEELSSELAEGKKVLVAYNSTTNQHSIHAYAIEGEPSFKPAWVYRAVLKRGGKLSDELFFTPDMFYHSVYGVERLLAGGLYLITDTGLADRIRTLSAMVKDDGQGYLQKMEWKP